MRSASCSLGAWHGGVYVPGTRILRSAQILRSATVRRSRNGLALTIFSRLVRPALAITEAASASSSADKIATAPAPPAKCAKYSVPGVTEKPLFFS